YQRGGNFSNIVFIKVPGIEYNTTYDVQVSAYTNGSWGAYGAACTVKTPPGDALLSQYCGITLTNLTDAAFIDAVSGATNYRYQLVNGATTLNYTRGNNFTNIIFSSVPSIQLSTTYSVSVSAYVNGSWGAYGPVCQVTTPGTQLLPAY